MILYLIHVVTGNATPCFRPYIVKLSPIPIAEFTRIVLCLSQLVASRRVLYVCFSIALVATVPPLELFAALLPILGGCLVGGVRPCFRNVFLSICRYWRTWDSRAAVFSLHLKAKSAFCA